MKETEKGTACVCVREGQIEKRTREKLTKCIKHFEQDGGSWAQCATEGKSEAGKKNERPEQERSRKNI